MNRKLIFILLTFHLAYGSLAQDLARVDASILLYAQRFEEPDELARYIQRDYPHPEEKLRAIYGWIAHNVAYDPAEYDRLDYRFRNYKERNAIEDQKRQDIIHRAIRAGVAVCEGYAMLFERLCELVGIQSYLVRGDAKATFADIGRPFEKSHMWNVAFIDGVPHLFDVTWGAGRYTDRFVPEVSYAYFKTPPELFIRSHYPELYEDSLLTVALSPFTFSDLPLIMYPDLKIKDVVSPQWGVIDSDDPDGVINFQLILPGVRSVEYSYGDQQAPAVFNQMGEVVYFEVPLELGQKELLVSINGLPALGYRIE